MTTVVDARDVDHAAETLAATFICEGILRSGKRCTDDPCAVCSVLGLLRQARRYAAAEVPF